MSDITSTPDWYPAVIEILLTEPLDFCQAANSVGIPLTPDDARAHQRRKAWKELWAAAERKHYAVESSPSNLDKEILIGRMLVEYKRLSGIGRAKEAADVLANIAKVKGYTGAETNINFFDKFSGADLNAIQEDLRKKSEKPN